MPPLLWLVLAAPPTAFAVPPPLPVLQPEVAQRLLDPPVCLAPASTVIFPWGMVR